MVFVLLLAITALLHKRRTNEATNASYERIVRELKDPGMDTEAFIASVEAGIIDGENWRELVRNPVVTSRFADPTPEGIVSALSEGYNAQVLNTEYQDIHSTLGKAGLQPTAKVLESLAKVATVVRDVPLATTDLTRLVDVGLAFEDALDDAGDPLGTGADRSSQGYFASLLNDARQWQQQTATRDGAVGTGPGGTGTDNPSCWYDRDGTVAYLFDVALTDRGFILEAARAPQHQGERASLPLERIETGRSLTPREFVRQTLPVFRWSVDRKCRFFVRAFDRTGPAEKELYKVRMRTLEGHFYKNANPTGPSPF